MPMLHAIDITFMKRTFIFSHLFHYFANLSKNFPQKENTHNITLTLRNGRRYTRDEVVFKTVRSDVVDELMLNIKSM